MELSYNAKLLLALYLELFNEPYDTKNNIKYSGNDCMSVRHVKMQNVCYLFQNLGINIESFSFSQNGYVPYSLGLEALLIDLDKKEDSINSFYEEYNEKRNKCYIDGYSYNQQLQELLHDYLEEDKIEIVAKACYLLEDIVNQQMGREVLISMILYLSKTIYPEEDFEEVSSRMIGRGYLTTESRLNKKIWKCLTLLGIIRMKPKKAKISEKEKIFQKSNEPLH